jgi:hypothetical protein
MAKPFDPKAKAKKQKIVAALLGVVLLGVLVFQAPTILGLFRGSSTTASEPTPPPPPPAATTPSSSAAPTAVAAPAAAGSAQLVDSDVTPEPSEGQLVTFDRFTSKDPFAPQGGENTGESAPSRSAPRRESTLPDGVTDPEPQPAAPPPRAARTATISVNGVSDQVTLGGTFPDEDPIFKLVALRKATAKIGIVDGTYASGSQTITLKRGKPVTLMNTADGTTYVLRLISVE